MLIWPKTLQLGIKISFVMIYVFFCRDDVQQLFREKDRDFDGYLSFEEFVGQETKIEMAFKVSKQFLGPFM